MADDVGNGVALPGSRGTLHDNPIGYFQLLSYASLLIIKRFGEKQVLRRDVGHIFAIGGTVSAVSRQLDSSRFPFGIDDKRRHCTGQRPVSQSPHQMPHTFKVVSGQICAARPSKQRPVG